MKAPKQKFQLLRQLTTNQLLAVFFGVLCLSLTYFFVTRATYKEALLKERAKVMLSLEEQHEKWRTWKQIGLEEVLKDELTSHAKVFALSDLVVLPVADLPSKLKREEIVMPKPKGLSADTLVVFARLNAEHIEAAYVPYRSNLVLLVLSGVLFTFVIFLSSRYIRRHIYTPFLELRGVFEAYNAGREVNEADIKAEGEIREFTLSLMDLYRKLKENEKNAAMVSVAKQVAHDIRSPLAALDMILDTLSQVPEQKRMIIRGALSRIRDIANNVLERSRRSTAILPDTAPRPGKVGTEDVSSHPIASLAEAIVTEKQVLMQDRPDAVLDIRIEDCAYGLFIDVQPNGFKTAVSNLVNNSLEALEGKGRVEVRVKAGPGQTAKITVSDNGRGIPAEILAKLRTQGGSFNKEGGCGLGLSDAKRLIDSWGGRLEMGSVQGVGTQVDIYIPQVKPPRWFVPKIEVAEGSTVMVLDDDPSIHLVWQQRFNDAMKAAGAGIFLEHFSDTVSLHRWCTENQRLMSSVLFLCDFEILGAPENGLQVIRSLALSHRAVLVTGRFDEPALRQECDRLGIRLLPKGLGGCVPITILKRVAAAANHAEAGSLVDAVAP